jgi:hypothetical protein
VRLVRAGAGFTLRLADSGRFRIVPTTGAVEKQIAAGQTVADVAGVTAQPCFARTTSTSRAATPV